MVLRHGIIEIGKQFRELLRKIIGRPVAPVALQGIGRPPVRAGCAAQAEIDPSGKRPLSMLKVSATLKGL